MEERRLKGARLLKEGRLSQAEIARQIGVSRTAVGHWARRLKSGGLRRLKRRKSSGRPFRLSRSQCRRLLRLLKRGALAAGFDTDHWTQARVQQVIRREFGVRYHPHYPGRLLKRLGWGQD
jgi:putative transposase